MRSDYRPGQLKLGRSVASERRRQHLRTADPSLQIVETFRFLDATAAERAAQLRFASQRIDGEWFAVSVADAVDFYRGLQAGETEAILFTLNAAAFLTKNGAAGPSSSPTVGALSCLLGRSLGTSGMTVRAAVPVALRAPNPARVTAALQRAGLLVQRTDDVVLLDRSPSSALERFFEKTPFAKTWRGTLAKVAGIDVRGEPVKMAVWRSRTVASQKTIDQVCAE